MDHEMRRFSRGSRAENSFLMGDGASSQLRNDDDERHISAYQVDRRDQVESPVKADDSSVTSPNHLGPPVVHTSGSEGMPSASLLSEEDKTPCNNQVTDPENRSSTLQRLLLDTWICESLAMFFSIGSMIAIAVIIKHFEGKPIPQMLSGVTLNTIIAVLSTAARSGLIFVVSGSLGQLKWCWFTQGKRRLRDIEVLDNASRGPLGSISALSSALGGPLAWLGAITTVLMVAFSPFLQQLLEYPTRDHRFLTSEATVPRTTNYAASTFSSGGAATTTNETSRNPLYIAIEAGAKAVRPEKLFDQQVQCPSDRCSWESFKSVGWCSECEDRTALATLSNCELRGSLHMGGSYDEETDNATSSRDSKCVLSLGDGSDVYGANVSLVQPAKDWKKSFRQDGKSSKEEHILLDLMTEVTWAVSYGQLGGIDVGGSEPAEGRFAEDPWTWGRNTSFVGVSNPLMVFGHAKLNVDLPSGLQSGMLEDDRNVVSIKEASQCFLTLCEKEYSVEARGGITSPMELSRNYGTVFHHTYYEPGNPWEFGTVCWQPEPGETNLDDATSEGGVYALLIDKERRAFCNVASILVDDRVAGQSWSKFEVYREDNLTLDTLEFQPAGEDDSGFYESTYEGISAARDLGQRFENMAAAMTNYGLSNSTDQVNGFAHVDETFVRVRWRWMILPVVLQLLSLVLFVTTAIQSNRLGVPIWKSSILAAMYHDATKHHDDDDADLNRLSGMHNAARTTSVQFAKGDDDACHLLQRSSAGVAAQRG